MTDQNPGDPKPGDPIIVTVGGVPTEVNAPPVPTPGPLPDIHTPGPEAGPYAPVPKPLPWENPDHPANPLQQRHAWMAVGALAFAALFVLVGLYRGGYIGPALHKLPELPKEPPVAGCSIVGDSVAHGLATQAPTFKGKCTENAKVGIPAWDVADRIDPNRALYIISAGSNQPKDPRTAEAFDAIRARVTNTGSKVVWVLPVNPAARAAAAAVALRHGDGTVTFTPGKDRVHPRAYEPLAKAIVQAVPLPE